MIRDSSSAGSPQVEIPPGLCAKLGEVQRCLSRAGSLLGLLASLGGISAFLLAGVLLDRSIRFSSGGRWLMFAGLLLMLLLVGGVFILLRRRWRLSAFQVAHRLENLFPTLKGDLLGTIELSRREDPESERVSAGMIRLLALETDRRTAGLDFSSLIPRRRLRRYRTFAAIPVVALLLYGLIFPRHCATSLLRIGLPFARVDPFTRTHMEVTPGNTVFARGTDFPIEVSCRGDLPSRAVIQFAFLDADEASTKGQEWQRVALDPTAPGNFRHVIPGAKENVMYRALAGDARSPRFLARAVDRARVVQVDLHYTYPAYTGFPSRDEVGSMGDIVGLIGTEVVISACASREPVSARLVLPDGREVLMLQTTADSFEGSLIVGEDGTYGILLEDEFGLNEDGIFRREIQAIPDRPPVVRIVRPGVQQNVLPHATLPVEFDVTDDLGVNRAWLSYQVTDAEVGEGDQQVHSLVEEAAGTQIRETWPWDLSTLSLEPGDRIAYRVHAADSRPPSGQEGRSPEHTLHVVSPFEELARLATLQAKILEQLASLQNRERQLQQAWERLASAAKRGSELLPLEQQALDTASAGQQRIAADAREILDAYKQLRSSTLKHPYLAADLGARVSELTEAFRRLADEDMPGAASRMREAAALAQSPPPAEPEKRREAFRDAESSLRNAVEGLQNLQRATAALAKAQAAVSLLNAAREVEQDQEQIGKEIDDLVLRQGAPDSDSPALRAEDRKQLADLAAQQEKLARDFDELQKEFALSNERDRWIPPPNQEREPVSPGIRRAGRLLSDNTVPTGMRGAAGQLEDNEVHRALAQEDQVEQWLEGIREGLEELASREAQPSPDEGRDAMVGLESETKRLRDFQETMNQQIGALSKQDGERAREVSELEAKLAEWAQELEPWGRELSKQWPALSLAAAEHLNRAAEDMERASRAVEEKRAAEGLAEAAAALEKVDQTREELARASECLGNTATYQAAAHALSDLDRMETQQSALNEKAEDIRRSLENQSPREGQPASSTEQARLRRLAEAELRLSDALRQMASRSPQATGQPRSDCAHCERLSSLAQRMADAASAMQTGKLPPKAGRIHQEVADAFRELRKDLSQAISASQSAMRARVARGQAGGPARSGYRFAPGKEGQGSPDAALAGGSYGDTWAALPPRVLAELEKDAAESFAGEFAALLRAYYRKLAQEAKLSSDNAPGGQNTATGSSP